MIPREISSARVVLDEIDIMSPMIMIGVGVGVNILYRVLMSLTRDDNERAGYFTNLRPSTVTA